MIYQAGISNEKGISDFDQGLIWSAIFLLSLGLIMVYSASISIAETSRGDGYAAYFLVRQGIYLVVGLIIGLIAFQIPMRLWQKYSLYPFLIGMALLVLVLIPGIGNEVNGSRRWLSLFVVNLQPSEFMKLFIVMYVASYTIKRAAYLDHFRRGFLPIFMVMVMLGILLLKEPDLGAFVVITVIVMAILFLGGMNLKLFGGIIGILLVSVLALIWLEPYRLERIISTLKPFDDEFGKGYQLSHSLMAFGRGGWEGVGLGGSVEKLYYLPEAHTDFLLAVIAEELGFIGVMVVVILFAWLVIRAFVIGRQAATRERFFPALVAQGIGAWIGIQAFINMGVNMGILPTKGLTLPLMSFGGSGIVANCIALAILLRIDWENRQLMKGYKI
ncbi:MAG: putative lipid II flippase FtsW [Nitrosomonadaceae bacterium]|jgi:cell division protein FtsW|nr:putative lipid II flippase FtsW [Nitrosomonadaceae bacterium]